VSILLRVYFLSLFATFSVAQAAEVYVNGVNVTGGVQNRAFQGVNVQFNAKGDVYIDAPGYTVKKDGALTRLETAPVTSQANAEKKYWIVLKNLQVGHYQVVLKVNSVKVANIASTRRQHLADITKALHSGKNEVEIIYYPAPDAPKVGALDGTEVIVGLGSSNVGGPLTLSRVLGTHKHKTGSNSAEAFLIPVVVP
jgi:hypothetical protein